MNTFLNNINLSLILKIILGFTIPIMILLLNLIINNSIKEQTKFLNEINDLTLSQLKSSLFRNLRYTLIQNLSKMKKLLGFIILTTFLILIGLGTFIVIDSKQYFKDYFEAKRKKLTLRTEASIDSLQNQIDSKIKVIDSINNINKELFTKIEVLNQKMIDNQEMIKKINQLKIENQKTLDTQK
jgi:hypothetical protein